MQLPVCERTKNFTIDNIVELLNKFDKALSTIFKDKLKNNENLKDDIKSFTNIRNNVAHGKNITNTINEIEKLFERSCLCLSLLEECLNEYVMRKS